MSHKGNNTITNATEPTSEPEYEWGVRHLNFEGAVVEKWGYSEDPRTSGVIDEDNDIEVIGDGFGFYAVLAVGKRIKPTENWETL